MRFSRDHPLPASFITRNIYDNSRSVVRLKKYSVAFRPVLIPYPACKRSTRIFPQPMVQLSSVLIVYIKTFRQRKEHFIMIPLNGENRLKSSRVKGLVRHGGGDCHDLNR